MVMADFLHGSRQRPPPLRIAESLDAPMEKPTEAAVEGLCRVIASVIKSPKRPGDFHLGYIYGIHVTINIAAPWILYEQEAKLSV